MQTDPLQQLRDIHLPADPGWWPPAFGWWIIALLVLGALAWLGNFAITSWRKRAPIRSARQLYAQLHQDLTKNSIDPQSYCHQCNEILKRLLVHGLGRKNLAAAADKQWLRALDEIVKGDDFSAGTGRQLGIERFQAQTEVDTHGLHKLMLKTLKMVRP